MHLVKTKEFFLRLTFYISVFSVWIFLQEEKVKSNCVLAKLSFLYPTKPVFFLFRFILEYLSFHKYQGYTSYLLTCDPKSAMVFFVFPKAPHVCTWFVLWGELLCSGQNAASFFCSTYVNVCVWPAGIKMSVFAECIKHYDILPFDPLCALNHLTHPVWWLRALKIHNDIMCLGTLLIYSMLSVRSDKKGKCFTPEPLLII